MYRVFCIGFIAQNTKCDTKKHLPVLLIEFPKDVSIGLCVKHTKIYNHVSSFATYTQNKKSLPRLYIPKKARQRLPLMARRCREIYLNPFYIYITDELEKRSTFF
jgi:hypothetical protein